MTVVEELVLDVAQKNILQTVIVKQFDYNARFLKIRLKNDGEPIYVDRDAYVTINALRADGKSRIFRGSVNSDGTVCVPITNWLLRLAEKAKCDVSIISPAPEQKYTTMTFNVLVEEACAPGCDLPEDDNYDILVSLIADCDAAKDGCDESAKKAGEAAEAANKAANSAAAAEESAKAAAEEAQKSKELADAATKAANDAAESATSAAGEATGAAENADRAAGEADAAKKAADKAAESAKSSAQNADRAAQEANESADGANLAAESAAGAARQT